MAALSDQDRADTWADFMRLNTDPWGALTKSDLRAALNAVDDWIVANAAAFNTAIPQPARAQLTAPQKARLLQLVAAARYIKGA
jgi:hypothetical protein